MFRCFHCHDLHISTDQARACFASEPDRYDEVVTEVGRILDRGPVPWRPGRSLRDEADWTMAERRLWRSLDAAFHGDVRSQWRVAGCDQKVDLFIPEASLAILIDPSPGAAGGRERLRSGAIRSNGVDVLRVPAAVAMTQADLIAATVTERTRAESPRPRAAVPA